MALIFIDANGWLGFWKVGAGRHKGELIPALLNLSDHLFIPSQTAFEVERQKLNCFLTDVGTSRPQLPNALPEHLLAADDTKAWQDARDALGAEFTRLHEQWKQSLVKVAEQISCSEDAVTNVLRPIFAAAVPDTPAQLQRARIRRERGNPPGKQKNNPSRRALLGAALGIPLLSLEQAVAATGRLHHAPAGHGGVRTAPGSPQALPAIPRPGEDRWRRALAAYEKAAGEVRGLERATRGRSFDEMAGLEERYGRLGDAMYSRLRRLLKAPAPDVAALAAKLDLVVEHEVGTLTGGETCIAALRRDAWRLAGRPSRE